jgi:ADP-ribose pyrophosphatase
MRMKNGQRASVLDDYLAFAKAYPQHFSFDPGKGILRLERAEIEAVESEVASIYRESGLDPGWARAGIYYEDPYIVLLRDAVRFSDGRPAIHHRILWKTGPVSGIVILPRLGEEYVLVKHYRHAVSAWSWECPRGGSSPGLSFEKTIEGELMEEIGANLLALCRLGHVVPINNLLDSGVDTFLAEVGRIGQPARSEGIDEVALVSAMELKRMIAEGEITDAPTICTVAQACFLGCFEKEQSASQK